MPKQCDVCYGTPGRYLVINRFGQQLYEIRCPECYGRGELVTEEELAESERPAKAFAST